MSSLRNINIAGCAAIVTVSVLGYFGGVRPIVEGQAHAMMVKNQLAERNDRLEADRAELERLDARVEELQATLDGYRSGFSASAATNERLSELAELADVVGVGLESVRPSAPVVSDSLRVIPIAVTGKGEFAALVRFLSRVKEVFPDFGIRRFSIDGEGSTGGRLSADLVWFSALDG